MSDELAWPKKGNRAFVSASRGRPFQLQPYPFPSSLKPEAFRIGAEMILEQCDGADHFRFCDELFFPVAYLYRHGLELLMKDIVYTGIHMNFFKRDDVHEALGNHDLARLWNHARKLLSDRWPDADPAPLKATEAVINEWHQADPNGQVFRYDEDKYGRWHRHETLPTKICPDELRRTMEGVFSFLHSTASCLRDDLSTMIEAARDCR